MNNFLSAFFAFAGIFLIITLLMLLLIKLGWALFVMPVLGMPDITWMQALGFSFLTSVFRSPSSTKG